MLIKMACSMYIMDRADKVRPNTFGGYDSTLQRHIIPDLGHIHVEELTPVKVQEWLMGKETRAIAEKCLSMLRRLYNWIGKTLGITGMDLFAFRYDMPKGEQYIPDVLDREETRTLVAAIAGQEWEIPVALCALCALRRCEGCGAMWEDMDFDTRELFIHQGVHYCQGQVMTLPPKTKKSKGVVIVPKFYMPRMELLRKESGLMCELPPHVVSNRYRRFCESAGIRYVPMRNLRNSWATQAMEEGMSLEDIMMYLRHTEINTSYRHYLVRTSKTAHRIADMME